MQEILRDNANVISIPLAPRTRVTALLQLSFIRRVGFTFCTFKRTSYIGHVRCHIGPCHIGRRRIDHVIGYASRIILGSGGILILGKSYLQA